MSKANKTNYTHITYTNPISEDTVLEESGTGRLGKLYTKVAGNWKEISDVKCKVNNSWQQVKQIYVKVNGVWNPVWIYGIYTGVSFAWDTCGSGYSDAQRSKTYSAVPGSTAVLTWKYDNCASSSIQFTGATITSRKVEYPEKGCMQLLTDTSTRLDLWRCSEMSEGYANAFVTANLLVNSSTLTINISARHTQAKFTLYYLRPSY